MLRSTVLEKVRLEILSQNCTLIHEIKKEKKGKELYLVSIGSSAGALIGDTAN